MLVNEVEMNRASGVDYSGEAKAQPFTGGIKPTTGNLSTPVATAGVRYFRNIIR